MVQKLRRDISIGANLKALRLKCGLSQEQVTVKLQLQGLKICRKVLSEIELGQSNIRISVLLALKDIYNASYEDLFSGSDM